MDDLNCVVCVILLFIYVGFFGIECEAWDYKGNKENLYRKREFWDVDRNGLFGTLYCGWYEHITTAFKMKFTTFSNDVDRKMTGGKYF